MLLRSLPLALALAAGRHLARRSRRPPFAVPSPSPWTGCRRHLCSSAKTTAGGSLRFPSAARPRSQQPEASEVVPDGDVAEAVTEDELLDYDEYVEYLGEDQDAPGRRDLDAAASEASAERRRRFLAECPVDARRRGRTGVIDPAELVSLLRHQNARDIVALMTTATTMSATSPTASVRPACLVVCTGRSSRHLLGLAEYALRVYKSRLQSDPLNPDAKAASAVIAMPAIEAGASPARCNWAAVDLGNCGLHCFLPETRARYDLESLWCLGPGLDPACLAAAAAAASRSSADFRAPDGVDWDEVARLAAAEKLGRAAGK